MKRGQGSLEYLLILAAVMAIAVVVVLVGTNVMGSGKTGAQVSIDKSNCAIEGIELVGYDTPYDGTEGTAPRKVKPCGTCGELGESGTANGWPEGVVYRSACKLGDYELRSYFVGGGWSVYLENSDGKYFVYGQKVEPGPPAGAIFPVSWSASEYGTDSECGSAENNFGKIHPSTESINITFIFSNSNDGTYNLTLYLKEPTPQTPFSIRVNNKDRECNRLEGDECKLTLENLPKNAKIVIESTGPQINICGGTGQPSNEYLHPPYLVPA